MLFLLWSLFACTPDPSPPGDGTDTGSVPSAGTGSASGEETSRTGTTATTGATGDTAPEPPQDGVYGLRRSGDDCVLWVDLPSGTTTERWCPPTGSDGAAGELTLAKRAYEVGGEALLGVAASYHDDDPTWGPDGVDVFDLTVVELATGMVTVLHRGVWASEGDHPDRRNVGDVLPTAPDRAFAAMHFVDDGRWSVVLARAGAPLVDLTPTATDVVLLGPAGDCVWAKVDGRVGELCSEGWTPEAPQVRDAMQRGDQVAFVQQASTTNQVELVLRSPAGTSRSAPVVDGGSVAVALAAGGEVYADHPGQVWVWDGTDGGEVDAVTSGSVFVDGFVVSPDGHRVAAAHTQAYQIYAGAADPPVLCAGSYISEAPAWSATGEHLVYVQALYPSGEAMFVCDSTNGRLVGDVDDVRPVHLVR